MSDKTVSDERLREILRLDSDLSVSFPSSIFACESVAITGDLLRLRAMERRLLEWETELDALRGQHGDIGQSIAAELRNRMNG